ncbi:MAG TPA: CHAT domain-containing tetratricopeptide repeat protein [Blastocatellia bacterium]|nr:CHAT domain-containing tetratricopeptide repeat protein [Blastocatellia bacterium]
MSKCSRRICLTVVTAFSLLSVSGVAARAAESSSTIAARVRQANTQTESNLLRPGSTLKREIGPGGDQSFRVPLLAGQYAKVILEQQGFDVAIDLLGPDGALIAAFDDEIRIDGAEEIDIVAEASGVYGLRVKAKFRGVPPGAFQIHMAEIREATAQDRLLLQTRTLATKATDLLNSGRYDEAIPVAERALAIAEQLHGPDDAHVAWPAISLAKIYENKVEFEKARPLLEHAVAILEKESPENPRTAFAVLQLGTTYMHLGQSAKADQLLRRALELSEKTLGPDHPQVADVLRTLGIFHQNRGDEDEAEKMYVRGLAIVDKTSPAANALTSDLLTNLGTIYSGHGDYARAEPLLLRSLAIAEEKWGKDNLQLANILQDLGIVELRGKKNYAAAQEYYERALSIREKVYGLNHSDVAANMINLANLYRTEGNLNRALQTHLQALAILERVAGPAQWVTVVSLGNIARTYAMLGDFPNAVKYQARMDSAVETDIALNVAIGSEREKLAFLDSVSDRTDRTISLNTMLAPDNAEASALAATVLLQRKGRSLDAVSASLEGLRNRSTADARAILDRLNEATARLARLVVDGPRKLSIDQYRSEVRSLVARKDDLETQMSQYSAEFRAQIRKVTLDSVQATIPEGAALIELAVYSPFNPKVENNSAAFGEPRYVAYVLRNRGVPAHVDLGEAKSIDNDARNLLKALRDPSRGDVRNLARDLDERIMRPVRKLAGDASQLLISADGELSLIPFDALVDEGDRFLIERYSISYLTSGRDLLRMQVARESKTGMAIIADPAFGEPERSVARVSDSPKTSETERSRSMTIAAELSDTYFGPLPGTAEEARSIKAIFPEATMLIGPEATLSAVKLIDAPAILHIATHGFFLRPAEAQQNEAENSRGGHVGAEPDAEVDNPLLRSGLALAGANLRRATGQSGILTALEASGLHLWGTKLVTLSACDTGVGEIKNGEVFGLRRAFLLAGAESLVMTLWPVSDYITRELMVGYYKNLKRGLGRGEALRRVQLEMLQTKDHRHPYYWASFIQSGDWRKL